MSFRSVGGTATSGSDYFAKTIDGRVAGHAGVRLLARKVAGNVAEIWPS